MTHLRSGAGQALRGDAADIQAVSPHKASLHKRHPASEDGAPQGGDEPRRPGADDYQIVHGARFGRPPLLRTDEGQELPVVLIVEETPRSSGQILHGVHSSDCPEGGMRFLSAFRAMRAT